MTFRFEELKVWQIALRLSNEIDILVKSFPREELYSLCSHMKRAADSVVLNIEEGSMGQSKPEFKRFLGIALRSAIEVYHVYLSQIQENIVMKLFLKNIMKNMRFSAK